MIQPLTVSRYCSQRASPLFGGKEATGSMVAAEANSCSASAETPDGDPEAPVSRAARTEHRATVQSCIGRRRADGVLVDVPAAAHKSRPRARSERQQAGRWGQSVGAARTDSPEAALVCS